MFCHITQKALENIQIQSTYKGAASEQTGAKCLIKNMNPLEKKVACHFSATVTVSVVKRGDKKNLENRCNLNYNFKNIMQNID